MTDKILDGYNKDQLLDLQAKIVSRLRQFSAAEAAAVGVISVCATSDCTGVATLLLKFCRECRTQMEEN